MEIDSSRRHSIADCDAEKNLELLGIAGGKYIVLVLEMLYNDHRKELDSYCDEE